MTRFLSALIVPALATAARAEVTDPAELFPPRVAAYAEITRPAELAAGLAAVFGGDPTTAARTRAGDATGPNDTFAARRAALWSLLTSPEFLAESKRVRGAAVGVRGFTSRGEPQLVAVFLLGESHAAGLAARAFLTTEPDLAGVATAGEVTIFQHRPAGLRPPRDRVQESASRDGSASDDAWEPTYAYTPGLFVVGTDVLGVSRVVARFTGRSDGSALARGESFWRARQAHDRSGVFLYVDLPTLVERHDEAASRGRRTDPGWLAFTRFAVNPRAVKSLSGSLTLGRESLTLTVETALPTDAASPLAAALLGTAVGPARLRFVAGQPLWAATTTLPPVNRAKTVLALADAVAKSRGALGELPSEAVARAAGGAGPTVADLLDTAFALTVFATATPNGTSPVVVFHTGGIADAERWDRGWPGVVSLLAGSTGGAEPSSELVGGVLVRTLALEGLPAIHAARVGSAVAVGSDRRVVAEAAAGTGSEPAVPATAQAAAVLWPNRWLPEVPVSKTPDIGSGTPQSPESWYAGLGRLARTLPPVTVTLTRTGDRLRFESRFPAPAKSLPAGFKAFLDWYAKRPTAPTSPQYLPRGVIDR